MMDDLYKCKLCGEGVEESYKENHYITCRNLKRNIEDSFELTHEIINNRYDECSACGQEFVCGARKECMEYVTKRKDGVSIAIRTWYHPECFPWVID